MDAARDSLFRKLTSNLEELTKFYSQLLGLVTTERELLMGADLDALNSSNAGKEALIMKIRFADTVRMKIAEEYAVSIGLDSRTPRLLELAKKAGGVEAKTLEALHGTLETLLSRVAEINRGNEEHAMSALKMLGGALGDLKENIAGKKTYGGKGQYKVGPDTTGNFVSKEA